MEVLERDSGPLHWGEAKTRRIAILLAALFAVLLAMIWLTFSGSRYQSSDRYPLRIALPTGFQAEASSGLASQAEGGEAAAPAPSLSVLTTEDARTQAELAASVNDSATEPGNLLALDYDLATLEPAAERYDRSDGSLETSMALFVDGKSSGSAAIRIEADARILIGTRDVSAAVAEKRGMLPARLARALETERGFIPFHELRTAGIAVDYDPVKDRISLSLPS